MSVDNQNQENKEQTNETDVVPKNVYKSAQEDMLKYKQQSKELKEKLAQLEAEKEAQSTTQLLEQKKYEELYHKANQKLQSIEQERQNERVKLVEGHKINAVIQTLGGFVKPEYSRFINRESIQVLEDGSVDSNSVQIEVERIKKEYPELIKSKSSHALPNQAPMGTRAKQYSDMTDEEKVQARRAAVSK